MKSMDFFGNEKSSKKPKENIHTSKYKTNMILDGGAYKITYTKDKKQAKITIGNEKIMTVMSARRIYNEVKEILDSEFDYELLDKLYLMNRDTNRCGYKSILKYQNISIELAVKIMQLKNMDNLGNDNKDIKSNVLEILNIGRTSSGKTRFILGSFLSKDTLKNFVPALTSLTETTACSIIYHLNSQTVKIEDNYDFRVDVKLKNEEEIRDSIRGLIIEAIEEYIITVKENSKNIADVEELCEKCKEAVIMSLESNYDKTFGLGKRESNISLAKDVEKLTISALVEYYGNSKSIDKIIDEDRYFIIRQLISECKDERFDISCDEINDMLNRFNTKKAYLNLVNGIYGKIKDDLDSYKDDYSSNACIGEIISYSGNASGEDTLNQLSHIFGNKRKQKSGYFYTIKPIVKMAEFYFNVKELEEISDKEIVLSDSVGINQGQKDLNIINEVVLNRIQESVQTRKPDIILYHTRLDDKDDNMYDIVSNLNAQGYGKSICIVSGMLDSVLTSYLKEQSLEIDHLDKELFDNFLEEINQIYVESDSATLNSIVENRYFICDKTNELADKFPYATDYSCTEILKKVIAFHSFHSINERSGTLYDDIDFMKMIQDNYVPESVYQQYQEQIKSMISMSNNMRWSTLQKAIEELRCNRYGYDILYPAFNVRNALAEELNKDEIKNKFIEKFGNDVDKIKIRYLLEVTDVAQIVLVTEYKAFMKRLLQMQYDADLRTDLSTSLTNDRKYNLQMLYKSCLEKKDIDGVSSLKIVFHIAWIRTLEYFNKKCN
jgi:hypothetical protein